MICHQKFSHAPIERPRPKTEECRCSISISHGYAGVLNFDYNTGFDFQARSEVRTLNEEEEPIVYLEIISRLSRRTVHHFLSQCGWELHSTYSSAGRTVYCLHQGLYLICSIF
jgi:hypothetical protein